MTHSHTVTLSHTLARSAVLFSLADNWAKNNAIRPEGNCRDSIPVLGMVMRLDTGTRYGNAILATFSSPSEKTRPRVLLKKE